MTKEIIIIIIMSDIMNNSDHHVLPNDNEEAPPRPPDDDDGEEEDFVSLVLTTITQPQLTDRTTELLKLTKLNLPECGLSSLPATLPDLCPNLSIMFLPKNQFRELPAVIGRCSQLQVKNTRVEVYLLLYLV